MGVNKSRISIMDQIAMADKPGEDQKDELRISEPIKSERIIHVGVDQQLQYHGLPQYWRIILGIDKEKSHDEFKTREGIDQQLLPSKATKKVLYLIKKITENSIIVSPPLKTEHQIHVQVDPTSLTGFRGLPPQLEKILLDSNFSKAEVMENPSEVFNAVSYADLYEQQANDLRLRNFPTNEEFKEMILNNFQLKKNDPVEQYQVIKRIGSGGYGSIFLCRAKKDKTKTYAMKIVKPANQDEITYIISEIAMMQIMKHQNIVPLLDAFLFKQHYFMILEFMDFGDLTKLIEKKWGSFPQDIIAYLMRETLQGLKELHDQHRIHRDLKSDNILISLTGEVKLADFGYIAQLTQEKRTRTTQVGTACWMAPQVIKKDDYDQKSDIWSLGITLYEITNKDPPYLGQKKARAFYAILVNDSPQPEPPEKWSPQLRDFAACCLKKDPHDRLTASMLLKHPFLKKIKGSTKESFKRFLVCE